MPRFLLQVVDGNTGEVAKTFPGGGNPPAATSLEADFIGHCTEHIVARGVGVFRTEAHVKQDIADGITTAIQALKDQTRGIV